MKTPEEIKKGLECCTPKYESKVWYSCSSECPYRPEGAFCRNVLQRDNIAYIQQLERERDVAVILLKGECFACLHNENGEPSRTKETCQRCLYNEDAWGMDLEYNWEWRGVEVE